MTAIPLHVAVYREPPRWCAHALECDVAVTASTAETALDALVKIIHAHVVHDQRHRRAPLSSWSAAPRRVWDAYAAAAALRAPITLTRAHPASVLQIQVAASPADGAP